MKIKNVNCRRCYQSLEIEKEDIELVIAYPIGYKLMETEKTRKKGWFKQEALRVVYKTTVPIVQRGFICMLCEGENFPNLSEEEIKKKGKAKVISKKWEVVWV